MSLWLLCLFVLVGVVVVLVCRIVSSTVVRQVVEPVVVAAPGSLTSAATPSSFEGDRKSTRLNSSHT